MFISWGCVGPSASLPMLCTDSQCCCSSLCIQPCTSGWYMQVGTETGLSSGHTTGMHAEVNISTPHIMHACR
jgi:hypothetical protein